MCDKQAYDEVVNQCNKAINTLRTDLELIDKHPETAVKMFKVYNGSLTVIVKQRINHKLKLELSGNAGTMEGLFLPAVAQDIAERVNKQSQTEVFRPMELHEWINEQIAVYEGIIARHSWELHNTH